MSYGTCGRLSVIAAVGLAAALAGCGPSDAEPQPRLRQTEVPATSNTSSTSATTSSLEEAIEPTDGSVTDLLIAGTSDRAAVEAAVVVAGGQLFPVPGSTTEWRARFEPQSIEELLVIRDALRAQGLNAAVVARLEPGDLGSGTPDDPA